MLRILLLDLVDDVIDGTEPALQLLLLLSPGLLSTAQGSILPFLQCLQMLLACLVGHNLQKVLAKEINVRNYLDRSEIKKLM